MQIQVVLDKVAKKQGISMYGLAKKLGVKPNALTVTRRPGYNPKLESLVVWSQALNVPVTDLFEVKGKATFIATAKAAIKKVAAGKTATVKKPAKPTTKKPIKTAAKTKN